MKRSALIIMIVLAAGVVTTHAADETRWLNITVEEAEDGANVKLHLPLDLVLSIIRSIDVDGFEAGKIDLDLEDAEIDWPQIIGAVKDAPDGEFVRVDSDDGNVKISKSNGYVHIHAAESGGDNALAKITMPLTLLDAFTVDEENRVDVAEILASLENLPSGDLIRVESDDANVRIWIE